MPIQINGTGTISGITAPIGMGGVTASNNITLTNASASDQYVTPSAHGYYVTLPDATTLTKGANLYTIYNNSNFFYGIEDNTGATLCFVPPFSSVPCSLADNSTAAGTWNFTNQQQLGTAAQAVVSLPSGTASTLMDMLVVNLDSRYQVIVFSTNAAIYAVAYDNTDNVFGSVVLVRTVTVNYTRLYRAIKTSTTSLLVVSCPGTGTALQAVLLTLSGTTITVNTAATATLAANINDTADIQVIGSSYVIAYTRNNIPSLRALTISGTTVTIGTEVTMSGQVFAGADQSGSNSIPSAIFRTSSSTFLAVTYSTSVFVMPYTVSGTTLTAGTQASVTTTGAPVNLYLNSNNRLMFLSQPTGQFAGHVVSVAGTTASISTVNLVARGTTASTFNTSSGALYTGNQMLCMFNQGTSTAGTAQYQVGFNVLTDNAGTAVAGTADVTQQSSASPCFAYMAGLDATSMYAIVIFSDSTNGLAYITAGISGNNPSILSTSYFTVSYGVNILNNPSTVLAYQQRGAGALTSMGNPTRGDFMSVNPLVSSINDNTPTGVRMGKNSITAQPFSSLKLGFSNTTSSYSGIVNATISNTYSDSTTLNQYGEVWSVSGVQATRIGSNSYSKVVITRLVYA